MDGDNGNDNATALAALERFVVDNDELLELEERIGRFNIFDALRIVDREVKHSDFLAWLLDPNESHGQGGLFLRAILMDLFKTARENGFPCPVSPVELDGEDLRGVDVRREWKNIDLLVRCQQPSFVIAIENKIKSGEHSDQLNRYRQTVEGEFGTMPSMYVFLTVEGDEPSEEDWVPYSYGDVYRVLSRVRNANEASIGEDVLAFLDHYMRLLRGRLMDDPKIDELCQTIYKNHRQAIDLILDRIGTGAGRIVVKIDELLREQGRWIVVKRTSQRVRFIPREWEDMLPSVGQESLVNNRWWFNLVFRVVKNRLIFHASVRPTSDLELRRRVIDRLTETADEFGFKTFFKNKKHVGNRYTTLGRETVMTWKQDEGPDEEGITNVVQEMLVQLMMRLAGMPDALRPIIAEWEKSQAAR